jgi:hypothetical protein
MGKAIENPSKIGFSIGSIRTILKGQSHEKVGEMRVEGDGLGPN